MNEIKTVTKSELSLLLVSVYSVFALTFEERSTSIHRLFGGGNVGGCSSSKYL
jgi:hypothetical protein